MPLVVAWPAVPLVTSGGVFGLLKLNSKYSALTQRWLRLLFQQQPSKQPVGQQESVTQLPQEVPQQPAASPQMGRFVVPMPTLPE